MATGNSTGERLRDRTAALIARLGVGVTVSHAGVACAHVSLVQTLSANDRGVAFRTSELADWLAPAYLITVAGDGEPVSVGDAITIPAAYTTPGDLHVLKIESVVVGEICVTTRLFCAATTGSSGGASGTGGDIEW